MRRRLEACAAPRRLRRSDRLQAQRLDRSVDRFGICLPSSSAGTGAWAIVATPLISAVFGVLANSGNAANGLFMASQVSLAAEAGLNVAAVIALPHVAALSLNMILPVRMSIVCSLAGPPGCERQAYRLMWPFAAAMIAVLLAVSLLIAVQVL